MPSCLIVLENHGEARSVGKPLSGNPAESDALGGRRWIGEAHRTLGSSEHFCQNMRVASSCPALQDELVHPPLSITGSPYSLNREAKAYGCLAEREDEFLALIITQGRLRWPQKLLQVAEYSVVIRRSVTLARNFARKQREGEWRLVLKQAAKGSKWILEVADPLDRRGPLGLEEWKLTNEGRSVRRLKTTCDCFGGFPRRIPQSGSTIERSFTHNEIAGLATTRPQYLH
jgi:hypothetical protein